MKQERRQHVSDLYYAALELPESKREAFLKLCEDDDVRREVLSMLSDEAAARSFLEAPALEVAARLETHNRSSLIGRQLSSYSLISKLGEGGMGVVYQAKGRKLGRDVAIKVLPEEFAQDKNRIARFQGEAKLLASLNHSNIAAIYGLEESDGIQFLVLELVEGETLAERIQREPIPTEEALKLALQIGEALEAAHEKGVIHRDLKPANIKITPGDEVKILDFGLAKAFSDNEGKAHSTDSQSREGITSEPGVILGTASYMSPEQARGRRVDKRTDIWVFGCILYEMLTAHPAFPGEGVAEIIAKVIKGDVDMDLLPSDISPTIRHVIVRCLQKDLKKRYRDIGDVQFEIEQSLEDLKKVSLQPVPAVAHKSKIRSVLPLIAAAILLTAIISVVVVGNIKPASKNLPLQVSYFTYALPEKQNFFGALNPLSYPIISISPDGSRFVYSTSDGLYLRPIDQPTARIIPGTEKPLVNPVFSPDGKWIVYLTRNNGQGQLEKISVNGGKPMVLCNTNIIPGIIWDTDDTIIYSEWNSIRSVSPNGGKPKVILEVSDPFFVLPTQLLPDGESLLISRINTLPPNHSKIFVRSLKTGEQNELFNGIAAHYVPTGHLLYRSLEGNINAVRFDPDTLEVAGEPIPVIRDVWVSNSCAYCAVSDTGTLIYIRKAPPTRSLSTLVWADREGKEETMGVPPDAYSNPRISPDGTKVAFCIEENGNKDIWIWALSAKP